MYDLKRSLTAPDFAFIVNASTFSRSAARLILCTIVCFSFTFHLNAQACNNNIQNNNFSIKPAVCAGTAALLAGSVPTGGNGTYQYQWEMSEGNCGAGNFKPIPGATGKDYLVPRNASTTICYRRRVISGACTSLSNSGKVQEDDRTTPTAPTTTVTQPTCSKATGTITISNPAPGGDFSYSIDGSDYSNTNGIFANVSAGSYSVTARHKSGCTSPARQVTIDAAEVLSGTVSPSTASFCTGGSQVLTATGGTTYQWYRNNVAIAGATAATFTAVQAGTYTAEIFAGNCKGKTSNSAVVTVTPSASGTITPSTGALCGNNTSITLTVTGGTSYQWYKDGVAIGGATGAALAVTAPGSYTADIMNGSCKGQASNAAVIVAGTVPTGSISPASATICPGQTQVLTVSGGTTYQWFKNGAAIPGATGNTYTATLEGTYTAEIRNGDCIGVATNSAVVAESKAIAFDVQTTDASCSVTTGTINITNVTGGSGAGYQYSKDNGSSFQAGNSFTGLAAGTYAVVVKDATGCASKAVSVNLKPFISSLQASASVKDVTCGQNSGSVTITAKGGVPPYQYSLNGGAYQSGNLFNNLATGTHKVTVKDAGGCLHDVSFVVEQSESALSATSTVVQPACSPSTGSVTIQANGGTPDYAYSLDNGVFQPSGSFGNLAIGSHKVVVKDKEGCTFTVDFEIKPKGKTPNLVITNPPRICAGATTDLRVVAIIAGSDPDLAFTYWKDAGATLPLSNPGAVSAGTYYIKAVNQDGCFVVKPVQVSLHTSAPGTITAAGPLAACTGESITLTASSGRTYQWYLDGAAISGATAAEYKATATGAYTVSINDGTCDVMSSNTIRLQFQACAALPTPDPKVVVPTAFTPNRNGANDALRPILYQVAELRSFKVFNRWGQQVFQTAVKGKGWDGSFNGSPQPADTYTWMVECVDVNGKLIKQSGRSLLIR